MRRTIILFVILALNAVACTTFIDSESLWKQLRNSPQQYIGKTVTLKIYMADWMPAGSNLRGNLSKTDLPGIMDWTALVPNELTTNIRAGDIIIVTGKFVGVTDNGDVGILPTKIKDLGVE
jgi:hypothetical protein